MTGRFSAGVARLGVAPWVEMASPSGSSVPLPAVFLSYAREDAVAVRRIAAALRVAGVEVWFDENELRGGDAWDKAIRKQVRDCTLFVPIISANTQTRHEGYFRLEWHLGEQRSLLISKGRPFIVPVCIDETPERDADAPEAFLAVQWMRLRDGENADAFVEQVKKLMAGGETPRATPPVGSSSAARKSRPTAEDGTPDIPDYEMIRRIGRGSYGDVWLARGITGIYRAIKVVWRGRFTDAAPFEREFKGLTEFAAISLGESIQMALLHIGRSDDAGYFYYVMELADDADRGRDIVPASYVPLTLTEARKRRGRLPAAECVGIGVELARVLAGLHKRGLIHRDIKPSNIILVGGVAKLADIGLVTPTNDASTFVGTEGFVPPEGPGSPSADVFALGKLLYELSTGLDRQEFPKLPAEAKQLPDRRALFELNEIIIHACERDAAKRYADGAGLLADLLALQAGSSMRGRRVGKYLLRWAAVLVVGGFGWWAWRLNLAATAAEKTIAVLPFTSLSDEKDDKAAFADGMQEDILINLGTIRALQVISRTSVMQYRATTKTIRQIGVELGVAYILEGSVRRVGNKVRVTGQLISTRTDQHVWAKAYDRDLADVFAIQSELAQEIAAALSATISPQEKEQLAQRPTVSMVVTVNPAAYERYVQARETRDELKKERLLAEVVALDPKFTQAWADLAGRRAYLYQRRDFHNPEWLAKIQAALDTANRLEPGGPSGLRAQGVFHLFVDRDYARSAEFLQRAQLLQPNSDETLEHLGYVYRRLGRWPESITALSQAAKLSPNYWDTNRHLAGLLAAVRRYDEAAAQYKHVSAIIPDDPEYRFDQVRVAFYARGSTREVDEWLANPQPFARDDLKVLQLKSGWLRERGDFAAAIQLDRTRPGPKREPSLTDLLGTGDHAAARLRAEKLLPESDAAVAKIREQAANEPSNWQPFYNNAMMHVLAGDPTRALRVAREILEIRAKRPDAWIDAGARYAYVKILAQAGEKDQALTELARLLRMPYGPNVYEVRHQPAWRSFRGDPRFEALLKDPKNNAPLY